MSLIAYLYVNSIQIDKIVMTRRDPFQGADKFYVYDVSDSEKTVAISHRYSDGARVLLTKAIDSLRKPAGSGVASEGDLPYTQVPPP